MPKHNYILNLRLKLNLYQVLILKQVKNENISSKLKLKYFVTRLENVTERIRLGSKLWSKLR